MKNELNCSICDQASCPGEESHKVESVSPAPAQGADAMVKRIDDYRSGYTCGYSDAKNGTRMRDKDAAGIYFNIDGVPDVAAPDDPAAPAQEVKRYAPYLDWDSMGYKAAMVECATAPKLYVLHSDYTSISAELQELKATLDLQHKRTALADKLWRAAHPGKEDVVPDLGELIDWLLHARKEKACWVGAEIIDAYHKVIATAEQERADAIGWKAVQAQFSDEKPRCKPNDHHWTNPRGDGSNNCLVCGMDVNAPSERELANFRAYEAELSRWSKRAEAAEAELERVKQERDAAKALLIEARTQRDWIIAKCGEIGVTVNVRIGAPIVAAYELVNTSASAAREALEKLVVKFEAVTAAVDPYIALQAIRSGNPKLYQGPTCEPELTDAKKLLAALNGGK